MMAAAISWRTLSTVASGALSKVCSTTRPILTGRSPNRGMSSMRFCGRSLASSRLASKRFTCSRSWPRSVGTRSSTYSYSSPGGGGGSGSLKISWLRLRAPVESTHTAIMLRIRQSAHISSGILSSVSASVVSRLDASCREPQAASNSVAAKSMWRVFIGYGAILSRRPSASGRGSRG